MSRNLISALAIALVAAPAAAAQSPPKPAAPDSAPRVQLAILLDNSGSMSGLIEQAKSELWRVVNELTTARRNGKQPRLQVALYTYGDPPPRQLNALTDDLDKVSESLFAVSINGGTEHCGQVIQTASRELAWSPSPNDLKLIFIAGNEPFTQGPVDYREACREAIAKGIMINTIHCGDGIPDDWRDGALLADGQAISINQNASQQSQASSVQRAVSKANAFYRNSAWDLVDALNDGRTKLADVKVEDLPENMRSMSLAERQQHVARQSAERQRLQDRINRLNGERNAFVAEKQKQQAAQSGEKTLDQALVDAIRSQASQKRFIFEEAGL